MKGRFLIFALLASVCVAFAAPEETSQVLVDGAIKDIETKKYDAALEKLTKADKQDPNSAFILNLFGAVWTKKKDFPKSQEYYEKALMSDPQFFPARFNIGEILFLQKKYPEALAYFASMLDRYPDNELLMFKVYLSLLMTDQMDEAQRFIKRFKYAGETPSWYFAHAAREAKEGNKAKSVEYVSMAKTVFEGKCDIFIQTFDDLGWATK